MFDFPVAILAVQRYRATIGSRLSRPAVHAGIQGKMLFLVAMIMMVPLGRIPAWIVCIFLMREVTVTALRGIAVDEGVVISASHWGKYKSAFVSTATVGLLLHYPFLDIRWRLAAWVLMIPSLVFSVGSGLHYAIGFFKGLAEEGSPA